DLGEIEYNDPFYDQIVLEEASNMQVGDVVGPISTEDGYAILYLAGRHISEGLTEEQQQQKAKVEVALQKVGSLIDVQEQLMNQYASGIKK
ncbi:MAG TPA: peptidyl-prolyl cis-trans isomerase, partial [Candidatus Paenibacillus intestinavium]|nr:peptidyl-prolyl cis-trans isomerase [Candidatus Paenibacillus intestinavium]